MLRYKKLMSFVIIGLISLLFIPSLQARTQPTVYLNGSQLTFDQPPIIENGRTLVPIRKIFESLGATVNYDANTRKIHAYKGDKNIHLTVGSKQAKVNNKTITIDVPAKTINGRTLVPLRFISESMDNVVNWDQKSYRISIIDPSLNSRVTPAKIGQYVHIKGDNWRLGKVDIDLAVTEIIRGSYANTIVKNANRFNDVPDPGYEYLLAKFRIKVNHVDNGALSITPVDFDLFSQTGAKYSDWVSVAGLSPAFRSDLYPGASYEGWVPFLVKTTDTPIISYDHGFSTEAWFKVN